MILSLKTDGKNSFDTYGDKIMESKNEANFARLVKLIETCHEELDQATNKIITVFKYWTCDGKLIGKLIKDKVLGDIHDNLH